MKLWEVLKELDENPKKMFKHESLDQRAFVIGGLIIEEGQHRKLIYMNNWQEVKQPVPWQEAFEEWLNGRTVFCFLENGKKVEYDQNINFIHAHSLKTGTWYIED